MSEGIIIAIVVIVCLFVTGIYFMSRYVEYNDGGDASNNIDFDSNGGFGFI